MSDMVNILYVIWSLGLGGAEQVVINLAKGLDKAKFQPFVCCLNDEGQFADVLKKDGIKVFALNKSKGIDLSVIPKLVKIIKENNIHIVHTHLWGANFWGRLAAKTAHVPVVVSEHGIQEYRTWLHFLIDRWLSHSTSKIIFVSDWVRQNYWKKLTDDHAKTEVIHNGVDVAAFGRKSPDTSHQTPEKKLKQGLGIKEDEKVIAVIGRLAPEKGVDIFLEAFSRLKVDAKALIVGEGPLEQSLKSQVARHKLEDKIRFLGLRKDIPEILSITDILVLPSLREGLPMILLEAMAVGVIVVASRVGGTPEVIEDGVNGFLVEPSNAENLKTKIEEILNADLRGSNADSRRSDEIRNNARKTIEEKFSLEKMITEHEKIYEQI